MDRKIYFALLFIAATGLCTGSFFEVFMTGQGKEQLIDILSNFLSHTDTGTDFSLLTAFWQTFRGSFLFLTLCFLSPLLFILLPVCVLYLFLKGLFMGFSATMLLETFGARGLLYTVLTLLPGGLLQVLLFAFLLMVSLKQSSHILAALHSRRGACGRKNRNALQCFTGQYVRIYLFGLMVLVFICLLEVFLLQVAL